MAIAPPASTQLRGDGTRDVDGDSTAAPYDPALDASYASQGEEDAGRSGAGDAGDLCAALSALELAPRHRAAVLKPKPNNKAQRRKILGRANRGQEGWAEFQRQQRAEKKAGAPVASERARWGEGRGQSSAGVFGPKVSFAVGRKPKRSTSGQHSAAADTGAPRPVSKASVPVTAPGQPEVTPTDEGAAGAQHAAAQTKADPSCRTGLRVLHSEGGTGLAQGAMLCVPGEHSGFVDIGRKAAIATAGARAEARQGFLEMRDSEVSALHAQLGIGQGGSLWLVDAGSRNVSVDCSLAVRGLSPSLVLVLVLAGDFCERAAPLPGWAVEPAVPALRGRPRSHWSHGAHCVHSASAQHGDSSGGSGGGTAGTNSQQAQLGCARHQRAARREGAARAAKPRARRFWTWGFGQPQAGAAVHCDAGAGWAQVLHR
jgi:hypothetical protein